MIDRLSDYLRKILWLRPLFYIGSGVSIIIFAYLILLGDGGKQEMYIIPVIVALLWSLLCSLLLSFFPHVPRKAEGHQRFFIRLKIWLIRMAYRLGLLLFCILSLTGVWLSLRMLNVWRTQF